MLANCSLPVVLYCLWNKQEAFETVAFLIPVKSGAALPTNINPRGWQRFLDLASSIFQTTEKIEILPKQAIFFQIVNMTVVTIKNCVHHARPNPNCREKLNFRFKCIFNVAQLHADVFHYVSAVIKLIINM